MNLKAKEKREQTLAVKTFKAQMAFLEELAKTGIVQHACSKMAVGRSTYYDWCNKFPQFHNLAKKAIHSGHLVINDLAESKLIQNIQKSENTAIIFWLKNRHEAYSDKMVHKHTHELSADLTVWERAQVTRALKLTGLDKVIKPGKAKPGDSTEHRGGLYTERGRVRRR